MKRKSIGDIKADETSHYWLTGGKIVQKMYHR